MKCAYPECGGNCTECQPGGAAYIINTLAKQIDAAAQGAAPTEPSREAFERYLTGTLKIPVTRNAQGHYKSRDARTAWHVWQAAQADRSAEADTARLDWLIGQNNCVIQYGTSGFWLSWIDEYDYSRSEVQKGAYPTAREAIDYAMGPPAAAEPGKGEGK